MGCIFFWIFTLMMALLIPGCMTVFGWYFLNHPPKNINSLFGYRSARSMRNQETWNFAHAYSGRFWVRAGGPVLALSLLWMALLFGKDVETVGNSTVILTAIQMIPFLAVIPATERALKREFDDFGRKR